MTFTRVAARSALEAAREWSYARLDPLKLSVSPNTLCGGATTPARRKISSHADPRNAHFAYPSLLFLSRTRIPA